MALDNTRKRHHTAPKYTVSKYVISKRNLLIGSFRIQVGGFRRLLIHIFTVCVTMRNMKNGLLVLFRVVRDDHLYLFSHLTALMCVDVSKYIMFLVLSLIHI